MVKAGWQAGVAAAAIAGACAVWLPGPVVGQEAVPRAPEAAEAVTTEGPDYCAHLQKKYAAIEHDPRAPAGAEADSLSVEGARLCGHGDIRAGILRLRRALVLIMKPAEHPAPP